MSLWPSEPGPAHAVTVPAPGRWRGRLGRAIRRATGRLVASTVLIESSGVLVWSASSDGLPEAHASFEAWCTRAGEGVALLVVSAHLLHSLALPLESVHGRTSLRDEAARSFIHYHGRAAERWSIAADAGGDAVFACAMHSFDLDAARRMARACGIGLVGAVPLWSQALPAAIGRAPALAGADAATLVLVEVTLVTCLDLRHGRLVAMQQRHLDAANADALAELLERRDAESGSSQSLTFVAGWGLAPGADAATTRPWRSIGHLDGRAADSAWLIVSSHRGRS